MVGMKTHRAVCCVLAIIVAASILGCEDETADAPVMQWCEDVVKHYAEADCSQVSEAEQQDEIDKCVERVGKKRDGAGEMTAFISNMQGWVDCILASSDCGEMMDECRVHLFVGE